MNNGWQPTPIDTRFIDPRAKAARAAMDGYAPLPTMEGYIAVPQEQLQAPAPGYSSLTTQVPQAAGQALGGEGGNLRGPVNPMEGRGGIYTQRQALIQEYQENEARIAELTARLNTVKQGIAKQQGIALDELDRRLAANRAGVGDIGNAYAHLGRIENRANAVKQQQLQAVKMGNDLVDSIQMIDQSLAHPENHWAREQLLLQRQQKLKQLQALGLNYPYAAPERKMTSDEWEKFRTEHTNKNGVWDDPANKALYEGRKTYTDAEAQKTKDSQGKKTEDEVKEIREKRKQRKAEADKLVRGLAMLDKAGSLSLKQELNQGLTHRAKIINEFYTYEDGQFKAKGNK